MVISGAEAEVKLLESGAERLAVVFNHQQQPVEISLALPGLKGAYTAADLVAGGAVPFNSEGKLARRIGALDVWVLRLSPRPR